jgi:hypothetical protein
VRYHREVPPSSNTASLLLQPIGLRASSGTKAQSNLNPFPGLDKPPISAAVTPPETHPFFGMRFWAPDCILWRNRTSSGRSRQTAPKSAAEFERFAGCFDAIWPDTTRLAGFRVVEARRAQINDATDGR